MHDDNYPGIQALPQRPQVNGVAPNVERDTRGDDITNRTPWVDLPAPFDNLEVRVWLDYRQETAELLTVPGPKPDGSPGETPEEASERIMEFLKTVILGHRGANGGPWRIDGEVLPSPETDEFWERIPTPLGRAISERFFEELQGNASRASRRARRKHSKRR